MKMQGYVKLINSADTHKESVLEMNILPSEKTPWHYHTLFSETFEIIKGTWISKCLHQTVYTSELKVNCP